MTSAKLYLPRAPPPNTITLVVLDLIHEFQRHIHSVHNRVPKTIFRMCSSKRENYKIYKEREENMAHSQKIKKAQTFELSVKDTAPTVLNMFKS